MVIPLSAVISWQWRLFCCHPATSNDNARLIRSGKQPFDGQCLVLQMQFGREQLFGKKVQRVFGSMLGALLSLLVGSVDVSAQIHWMGSLLSQRALQLQGGSDSTKACVRPLRARWMNSMIQNRPRSVVLCKLVGEREAATECAVDHSGQNQSANQNEQCIKIKTLKWLQ